MQCWGVVGRPNCHVRGTWPRPEPSACAQMKLTAVGILKWNGDAKDPTFIGVATDVSNFGYFQRATVREGLMFIARTIVQRTQPGQRQSVKSDEYFVHVHVKQDSMLAGVVVADADYPNTAAFSIISKVLDEFLAAHVDDPTWKGQEADGTLANHILEPALLKYQVGVFVCSGAWGRGAC